MATTRGASCSPGSNPPRARNPRLSLLVYTPNGDKHEIVLGRAATLQHLRDAVKVRSAPFMFAFDTLCKGECAWQKGDAFTFSHSLQSFFASEGGESQLLYAGEELVKNDASLHELGLSEGSEIFITRISPVASRCVWKKSNTAGMDRASVWHVLICVLLLDGCFKCATGIC
jgi:hypothetical protein